MGNAASAGGAEQGDGPPPQGKGDQQFNNDEYAYDQGAGAPNDGGYGPPPGLGGFDAPGGAGDMGYDGGMELAPYDEGYDEGGAMVPMAPLDRPAVPLQIPETVAGPRVQEPSVNNILVPVFSTMLKRVPMKKSQRSFADLISRWVDAPRCYQTERR